MRLNFDSHSIRFRIWLYFIIFAAVLMVILWFLQIFFLNNYYATMKSENTDNAAMQIASAYANCDTDDQFIKEVDSISKSNDIYTYFETNDGYDAFPQKNWDNKATSSIYSSEKTAARQKLNSATSSVTDFSFKVKQTNADNETFVHSANIGKINAPTIRMYIFSPLYPVHNTISILKNQLIYITVIALVLAVLISFYLSSMISNPIRNITRSAGKLAQGEYGVVFKGGGYTEISNLAETLTRASIKLEKSDSLQKDLIANVSHDLRTPLTMVKSYAEMIRDISGDDPESRDAHLQVIMDEADRLNLLVDDLLALSRMQVGTLQIRRSHFNMRDLIELLLKSYELLEEQEGYKIEFNCKENLFFVNADEERIKQVVSNLINNAIKFCGTDKKVIIKLRNRGGKIICQVIDHGVGIPKDEINHIWERYYKASSNMVRSTKGTGLGLSIVKEILSLHNAKFGVFSKIGHGTTFWFELFAAPSEQTSDSYNRKKMLSYISKRHKNHNAKRTLHDHDSIK